jgi:hypothetical protein
MIKDLLKKWNIDPVIAAIALFNVVFRLFVFGNLEYHRDELLYFSLGMHPDFGYASVPPLIGWIAWLMEHILGYSVFAVRIVPAITSGVMVLILSSMAKELGGNRYAQRIAALGMLIPIFALRSFSLYMPVFLDIFFWTLSIYLIIRYINSGSEKYLLIFGIVAGLSLLNKYLIALLFFIILAVIPFTKHRKVLTIKMFWTGIGIGALLFLPNLVWQIVNGMPVFGHLSDLARTQLTHVDRNSFLIEQLASPGAATLLTIPGLLYLLISRKAIRFRFLALTVIIVIVSLMIMKGKSYYTIGVFPSLIAAGAVFYEKVLKSWYLKALLPLILIFVTIIGIPFGVPVFNAEGLKKYFDHVEGKYGIDIGRTFEDGSKHTLPQDYADMLGWEELTGLAYTAYNMIEDKKAAFIYCENYGQAGAITVIGKKYGLPEAISFNESFRYWIPEKFDPDITSLVYINFEMGEDVKSIFRKITNVGSISNRDAREYGLRVYLCQEPVESFNKFWKIRLQMLENE